MERYNNHVIVIYVLIALLAAWTFYDLVTTEDEVWTCSNVICSSVAGPEEWTRQNCFDAATEQSVQTVCRVQVDGVPRIVPLADLNLSGVQVCSQYSCVQEVRVREVNYPVNASSN